MKTTIFGLLLLASSMTLAEGQGRAPAVEDFVGIEAPQVKDVTPKGTHTLFNFEKDIQNYEQSADTQTPVIVKYPSATIIETPSRELSPGVVPALLAALALPLIGWAFAMQRIVKMKQVSQASVASKPLTVAEPERLAPVISLEEQKNKKNGKSDKDQWKKAS